MNVASLELCKKLFKLSGWQYTDYIWYTWHRLKIKEVRYNSHGLSPAQNEKDTAQVYPAYDLGYLLRKLPDSLKHPATGNKYMLGIGRGYGTKQWYADYQRSMLPHAKADTPEDAAAKLAVELFKQGVLGGDTK